MKHSANLEKALNTSLGKLKNTADVKNHQSDYVAQTRKNPPGFQSGISRFEAPG
jgi:hypothetical protein